MMAQNKRFDCVEMKRRASLALHEKLSKMSLEEEIAFWEQTAREMRERQAAARRKQAAGTAPAKASTAKRGATKKG